MQSTVYVHYKDVNERGPRLGCGFKSEHRQVHEICEVEGGEQGSITYKGYDVPVYRRDAQDIWTTDYEHLGPIKVTKVF